MKWPTLWEWVTVEVTFETNTEEWVFPVGKGEGPFEKRKLHIQKHRSTKRELVTAYSGHFKLLHVVSACPCRKGAKNQARGQQSYMMKNLTWNAKKFWFYSGQDGVCIWARRLWLIVKNRWQECQAGTKKDSEGAAVVIQARDDETRTELVRVRRIVRVELRDI